MLTPAPYRRLCVMKFSASAGRLRSALLQLSDCSIGIDTREVGERAGGGQGQVQYQRPPRKKQAAATSRFATAKFRVESTRSAIHKFRTKCKGAHLKLAATKSEPLTAAYCCEERRAADRALKYPCGLSTEPAAETIKRRNERRLLEQRW